MIQEDLKDLLNQRPFEPFAIRMSSGERYEVKDPSGVALMRNRVFITYREGERWLMCPYLHIASLESMTAA